VWAGGNTADISDRFMAFTGGKAIFNTNGNDVTFATGLAGDAFLFKGGAGTLTLTGNGTHTGNFRAYEGTLQIGNGGTSGSLASAEIQVYSGTTLAFNRSDNHTHAGTLTNSGTLAQNGAGTLTLTGISDITNVAVNAGGLHLAAPGGSYLGADGTISVASGTVLSLGANNQIADSATLALAGGTFRLNGYTDSLGYLTQSASSTLDFLGAGGQVSFIGNTPLQPWFSPVGSLGTLTGTLTVANWAGSLSGSGAEQFIVYSPGGAPSLTAFAFTGWGAPAAIARPDLGTGFYEIVGTSSTNEWNIDSAATQLWGNTAGWSAGTVPDGADAHAVLGDTSGSAPLDNNVTLSLEATNRTLNKLTFENSADRSYTVGAGTAGRLDFDASSGNAQIIVNDDGAHTLAADSQVRSGLLVTNGSSATAGLTLAGDLELRSADDLTFNGTGTTVVTGDITQGTLSTELVKAGPGTLTLAGTASHNGGTTVDAGTLNVTGTLNNGLVQNAGTTNVTGTLNGGVTLLGGTLSIGTGGGAGVVAGDLATSSGSLVYFNRSGDHSFADDIIGGGAVTKSGSGVLTLAGTNNYSGATTISAGTLRAGAATAFSDTSIYTVAAGATLDLNGYSSEIGNLSGSGIVSLGGATLTLGETGGATTFAGGITGTGNLMLPSGGNVTLSGTNTFAGTLTMPALAYNGAPATRLTLGSATALPSDLALVMSGSNLPNFGALLDVGGHAVTVGSLSGAGRINTSVAGGSLAFGADNGSTSFSWLWGATGTPATLVKNGTGTLTLASHLGNFTVNGGTVNWSGTASNSYPSAALAAGTTLQLNSSNWGSAVSGNGGFNNISGAGTIVVPASTQFQFTALPDFSGQIVASGRIGFPVSSPASAAIHLNYGNTTTQGILEVGGSLLTVGSLTGDGLVNFNATAGGPTTELRVGWDNSSFSFDGGFKGYGVKVIKDGTGTMTLNVDGGTTAYSQGNSTWLISNGTLLVNALPVGGGTSAFTVESGGTFITNSGLQNLSYGAGAAAVLLEPGSTFLKQGTGTLALGSFGGYSGSTVQVDAGTLRDQTAAGEHSVVVGSGATYELSRSSGSGYLTGDVSGAGALVKGGAGTVVYAGDATHTGGTAITGGKLDVGSYLGHSGNLSGQVAIESGATLGFSRADASAFAGNTSGAGTVAKQSGGTLSVTGSLAHTGGTTVSAGTLRLGDGGTTGEISGSVSISSGAIIAYNRSDGYLFTGTTTGAGALQVLVGTLTASGSLDHTGGTSIGNGSQLVLTTGSSLGGDTTLSDGSTLMFNRADNSTHDGNVSGDGSITKSGAGTIALTGALAPTGGSQVLGGTMQIGTGGTGGSLTGNVYVNSGTTLAFNRADATTYAGDISGPGTLTQVGPGTLVLTGDNSPGATTVTAGTLQVGNGGAAGSLSGTISISTGATLSLDRSDASTYVGTTTGGGNIIKSGAGTLTVTGNLGHTGDTTVSAGTLQLGNGGSAGSLGAGEIAIGSGATFAVNRSDNLILANSISGAGMLMKAGDGTLTLTGTNSYSGATTVSAGTLQVGDGGNTGTISGAVSLGSGTVFIINRSDGLSLSGAISGAGSLQKLGGNTVTLAGANTYTGATVVAGGSLRLTDTPGLETVSVASGASLEWARPLGGVITGAITGSGTLIVSQGSLSIGPSSSASGGTAQLGINASVGAGANLTLVNWELGAGETLQHNASVSGAGSLTVQGLADASYPSYGLTRLAGTYTYTGGTTTFSNMVTGDNVLPVSRDVTVQNNALWLTGSQQVGSVLGTGHVNIASGKTLAVGGSVTARIEGEGALVFAPPTSSTTGSTVTGTITSTGGVALQQGVLQIGPGLYRAGGTSGAVEANINLAAGTQLIVNRADAYTYSHSLSGQGSLAIQGTGTVTLTGTNTHAGLTVVEAGTLVAGSSGALSPNSRLNVVYGSELLISGHNTVPSLVDSTDSRFGPGANGTITFTGLGQRSLTIGSDNASTTFSGTLRTELGSPFRGVLVKTGTGTFTGGSGARLGVVDVQAGGIHLAATAAADRITLGSGTMLSGFGNTGELEVGSGSFLSPGASPGTLNAANTTWAGGATYLWEINNATGTAGTGWDLLNITGSLAISATSANPFQLDLISLTLANTAGPAANFNAAQNHTFLIASTTAGVTGFDPAAFAVDTSSFANPFGGIWSVALSGNDIQLNYSVSAIPEPSTYAAFAGLAALGLAGWRRRRKSA
jgi:autotransporter-associated beta strand protein